MRLTWLLNQYRKGNARARAPQNLKKIPFKTIMPVALRDRVSGKVDSFGEKVPAIQELSVLFAALKDNDFDEKMCKKEIEAVNKAHLQGEAERREKKLQNLGKSVSTGRKLTSGQLNKYLKNFPIKAQDY